MYIRFRRQLARIKVNNALSTAAATASLRLTKDTDPSTWEFTGFSQNGEDGVIDYLTRRMLIPTRHFLEIGASDGMENNTSWLAFARRFSGLMVEGDRHKARLLQLTGPGRLPGIAVLNLFVDIDNLQMIQSRNPVDHLDVLSVDIDGNDYHIVSRLLQIGIRPAVLVVEYNATFGPQIAVTIPYYARFRYHNAHPSGLYFGASVAAWKLLCERHGLRFVTVDQNGVNLFAVDPGRYPPSFLELLRGTDFRDNVHQRQLANAGWEQRFEQIKDLEFQNVG